MVGNATEGEQGAVEEPSQAQVASQGQHLNILNT